MVIKDIFFIYLKNPFFITGFSLIFLKSFDWVPEINLFLRNLWVEQWSFIIIIPVALAAYLQLRKELLNERKCIGIDNEARKRLILISIQLLLVMEIEVIFYEIGIVELIGEQENLIPSHMAFKTWMLGVSVIGYFVAPFLTINAIKGDQLAAWITPRHRQIPGAYL